MRRRLFLDEARSAGARVSRMLAAGAWPMRRPRARAPANECGATLADLLVVCAIVAIISAVAIPTLGGVREQREGRLAARFLAQRLQLTRFEALRRNRAVAIRFDPEILGRMGVYVDGDGDGVRQADIDRGVDTRIGPDTAIGEYFAGVALRVAARVPRPEEDGTLEPGDDPIRLGGTNLLTFTPAGTATGGTIFLAARRGPQVCVRVFGATGRVRVLWFDASTRVWRQD
jgi:type II secretory pathway pseudopilin PulG